MIELKKYIELPVEIRNKMNSYIANEFGHIPIVAETEWATPNWTVIYYANSQIATFYNIIIREIRINDEKIRIGGINNVMTPKEYRGMGYASKTLRETENVIFNDLDCEMGLLLCADTLIPFYEKFNWYKIECPVYFEQSSGKKLWGARTMLLTRNGKVSPDKIELNGLPW